MTTTNADIDRYHTEHTSMGVPEVEDCETCVGNSPVTLVQFPEYLDFASLNGETDYSRVYCRRCSSRSTLVVIFTEDVPEHVTWHDQEGLL